MAKVYEHGEEFLYMGKSHAILISTNLDQKKDYVSFVEDKLYVFVKEQKDEAVRQAL